MIFRLRTVLPFLLPLSLFAQQSSPLPSPQSTVQLNVTVTGRSGKPISDLTQSNFTVLDNGSPQQILSFHAVSGPSSSQPIEVIVLVDTVNASLSSVAYERYQIRKFLRKSGPTLPYPLSFIFFSDSGTEIQRASRSTAVLLANLDQQMIRLHTIHRSSGFYGVVERIHLSLGMLDTIAALEQKKPGRKLLLWISPGWPYLSGPNISLSISDRRSLFSSVVSFSTELQRSNITLYSIDPHGVAGSQFHANFYKAFLKDVASPKDVQNGNLALQVLAQHTGGQVFHSGNDLTSAIAACIDDASAFYVLTIPRAPADSPDTLHVIQVKLPDTNLKARTISGYYAQPAAASLEAPR